MKRISLKNKMKYILNESVCFDPELNTLHSCLRPGSAIKLHAPTSKCLHLLLLQNSQTVTQQFLFAEIWEKNGFIVSNSTLYQNISALRKAIRGAGLTEEIIKTIPKLGFKSVATLREVEDDIFPQVNAAAVSAEQPLMSTASALVTAEASSSASTEKNKGYYPNHYKVWYYLIAVVFIATSFVCYRSVYIRPVVTSGFPFVASVGGCKVYSSRPSFNRKRLEDSSVLRRAAAYCNPGDIIYLTMSQGYGMSSAFICDKPSNKPHAICRSYLTTEDANEQ